MKLSVFTTSTYPEKRGDLYQEACKSYQFADELVEVAGDEFGEPRRMGNQTIIYSPWPKEFDFSLIGKQFQKGYEACTGDWVIHADLDFIFHENDYRAIRAACESTDAPALSFWKYQFLLPDRYTLKSRLVVAVNKREYGDRIKFDSGGDLCQPSLDGVEIDPNEIPEARIPFYNYERIIKTRSQLKEDLGRMARAYQRTFGEYKLGGPDDASAYEEFIKMTAGRFNAREHKIIRIQDHPKVMHRVLRNLNPNMWGYDGFGNLPRCSYV